MSRSDQTREMLQGSKEALDEDAPAPAEQLSSPMPRVLRVEVNGLLHDWFDVDEMGDFIKSSAFASTLRENVARYFGVAVQNQAIYDEDGLLTTNADFSRALQRVSPMIYVHDVREMGNDLMERTVEELEMIDNEVRMSSNTLRMRAGKAPLATSTEEDVQPAEVAGEKDVGCNGTGISVASGAYATEGGSGGTPNEQQQIAHTCSSAHHGVASNEASTVHGSTHGHGSTATAQTAEAKLRVTVIGAHGLANMDGFLAGKSDPYVVCQVVGKKIQRFQTKVINDSLDPVWDHTSELVGYSPGDGLEFQVWDNDTFPKPDQLMCKAHLPASSFCPHGVECELPLTGGKSTGATLHVRVSVVHETAGLAASPAPVHRPATTATASPALAGKLVHVTPVGRAATPTSQSGGGRSVQEPGHAATHASLTTATVGASVPSTVGTMATAFAQQPGVMLGGGARVGGMASSMSTPHLGQVTRLQCANNGVGAGPPAAVTLVPTDGQHHMHPSAASHHLRPAAVSLGACGSRSLSPKRILDKDATSTMEVHDPSGAQLFSLLAPGTATTAAPSSMSETIRMTPGPITPQQVQVLGPGGVSPRLSAAPDSSRRAEPIHGMHVVRRLLSPSGRAQMQGGAAAQVPVQYVNAGQCPCAGRCSTPVLHSERGRRSELAGTLPPNFGGMHAPAGYPASRQAGAGIMQVHPLEGSRSPVRTTNRTPTPVTGRAATPVRVSVDAYMPIHPGGGSRSITPRRAGIPPGVVLPLAGGGNAGGLCMASLRNEPITGQPPSAPQSARLAMAPVAVQPLPGMHFPAACAGSTMNPPGGGAGAASVPTPYGLPVGGRVLGTLPQATGLEWRPLFGGAGTGASGMAVAAGGLMM